MRKWKFDYEGGIHTKKERIYFMLGKAIGVLFDDVDTLQTEAENYSNYLYTIYIVSY